MSARSAISTIESMRLRVGRIVDLNDPFDCSPHFVGNDASDREKILAEAINKKILADRSDKVGLLCFTRTWKDPVLWSHYADAHRGIALIIKQESSQMLFNVKYSNKRPPVPAAAVHGNMNQMELIKAMASSFTVKSPTWRYEQETRIIVKLNTCDPIGGDYFIPLPSKDLVGIILGLRCDYSPEYFKVIFNKLGPRKPKIWVAKKSDTRFSLVRGEA